MSADIRPVVIAGGGPVGSVLALALSRSGVAVTLVDKHAVDPAFVGAEHAEHGDRRPIALSASSARILHTLDVWPQIAPHACPIQMVHVCEQAHFGAVRLRASDYDLPALGYVTDASVIAAALAPAIARAEHITCIAATSIDDARLGAEQIHALLVAQPAAGQGKTDSDDGIDAQLLVVADGGHSSLCANLGVAAEHRDYRQQAVVCTVTPELAHQGIAYERFTPCGPLALLPMASGDCALVWTLPEAQAAATAVLDDAAFLQALQAAFGRRLGRLRAASARNMFALSLVRAQQLSATRVALIGNAANQLHPVAGQGLNLGLRDAAVLADLIAGAARAGDDPGSGALLQCYAQRRRAEHQGIVRFTDALARGFSVGPSWLGWLRSAGMLALDVLPGARHVLARHAMGLGGSQARLLRGLNP